MAELIDQLLSDGPTEEELRRAKAQFERQWLHELARVDSRADALGEFATLHGDPHLINSRIAEITSVGSEEVRDAVREWLHPDQRATLIYRQEAS
jgi:predicted Zn-dependent peptidase